MHTRHIHETYTEIGGQREDGGVNKRKKKVPMKGNEKKLKEKEKCQNKCIKRKIQNQCSLHAIFICLKQVKSFWAS